MIFTRKTTEVPILSTNATTTQQVEVMEPPLDGNSTGTSAEWRDLHPYGYSALLFQDAYYEMLFQPDKKNGCLPKHAKELPSRLNRAHIS